MEDLHREAFQAIECLIMTREKKVQNRQAIANKLAQDVSSADKKWTITQLHIVSLINRYKDVNNTFLANELKISKPAVSKAINILTQYAIVIAHKNEGNNKETFYSLTSEGEKLATIHDKMHEITKEKYLKLLNKFLDSELKIIIKFLDEWTKQI
ncbi:MarR family transcriptional regulator [Priestia endophytica]|jgi:DNA-binding MarR family transcriptional regulator|uniref:MarR family transcriptional regulator n=1 Tax=Priestia endophytica TaxID=135735 RepID=UPI002E230C90|nr:MarR family transcriptional regulator [Priestia endophytica]MED4074621.1 MarR family transcriptional regulator [Priestia endophytica]